MTTRTSRAAAIRLIVALIGVAALGASGLPAAVSQTPAEICEPGGDCTAVAQTYNACHRNDGEKLVRIVKSGAECGPHETGFQFGQGTPGEPGPAGPPSAIGSGIEVEATSVDLGSEDRVVMRAIDVARGVSGAYFAIGTLTFRPRGDFEHVGVQCRFTTTPASSPPDLVVFNDGPLVSATMIDQFLVSSPTPEIGVACRSSLVPPRPMQLQQGKLWVKLLEEDVGG